MISETWLSDIVPDEAVARPNFNLIGKDRLAGRGGEVQIYVRETIPCRLRFDLFDNQYECLWIVLYD